MSERSHLSIGEVLSLLQDEFPDVTISKIRFLESQGLLDPERTPSGYRKFYEVDVRRLRWILTEQRDNFLPLKVIKDRLDAGVDAELAAPDPSGNGAAAAIPGGSADVAAPGPTAAAAGATSRDATGPTPPQAPDPRPGPSGAEPPPVAPAAAESAPAGGPATPDAGEVDEPASLPIWMADAARAKVDRSRSGRATIGEGPNPVASSPTTAALSPGELLAASGLTPQQLASLDDYGLLAPRGKGDERTYGGEDLIVAQKAAGFLARGIEARHLRMFKNAADREASMIEQLVVPLTRQRRPEAHQEAQDLIEELASLGQAIRAALLRSALERSLR